MVYNCFQSSEKPGNDSNETKKQQVTRCAYSITFVEGEKRDTTALQTNLKGCKHDETGQIINWNEFYL